MYEEIDDAGTLSIYEDLQAVSEYVKAFTFNYTNFQGSQVNFSSSAK